MNIELEKSPLDWYRQEVARYRMLSNEEECAVIERMRQGDMQARKVLIESYLRLVVSMANNPKFRHQAEVLDLIQEGNIGLIKSVDCFDPATGNSFVAFAMECIKNRIILFLKKRHEELLILDSKVAENDEEYICGVDLVIDEDNVLGDASYEIVEDKMINEEREEHLYAKIERLPSREREIVQLLYGLGVRDAMSLQEVAMMVGLSKERVGQIRDGALKQLERLKG
jgi:RNA polymerase sporulation-specific sigma factor